MNLQTKCLRKLHGHALTADEVANELGRSCLSVRPRITELHNQGDIQDTGWMRRNRSGRFATVWIAVPRA